MVGYELIINWWVPYALWGGVAMIGMDVLIAMGLIANKEGKNIMDYWRDHESWVRRYRVEDGKLVKYWEKVYLPPGVSKWGVTADSYAPPGTKSVYLSEKQEWGYTEEIPPAPCVVFMSPELQPAVDKILETCRNNR